MGTGYTRNDTANNIADGNVINAADFDGEYDAIEAAFNATTGHTHDGTAAEGGPITVVGPVQDVVVSSTEMRPKTTNTLDLGTSSLEYKDLHLAGTANLPTVDIDAGAIDGVTLGTNSAVTELQVDNINVNGNAITSTDTNGNIALTPNGTGEVDISKVDIDSGAIDGVTIGTNSAVTELQVDNININGNAVTSTDTNGNITLTPNGTGEVDISKVDIDSGAIDGTIVGASTAAAGTFTNLTASTDLSLASGATVTAILDEDTLSSDSDTSLATQQSIKAYVDSQVGGADELSEILANNNVTAGTGIDFIDNDKARFGTGNDLEIFHNATDSIINDAGTGSLKLQQGGTTRIEVSTTGVNITDDLDINGDLDVGDDVSLSSDGAIVNMGADSEVNLTHVADTGLLLNVENTTTNAVTDVLKLQAQSSGTPAVGIGTGVEFSTETAAGNLETGGVIESSASGLTPTSEEFDMIFKTMSSGSTAAERLKLNGSGATVGNVNVNGNTVSSTDTNGNINLSPNGTGTVVINTDLDVDNINVNGNTVSSTDSNGNINLSPNGTGNVVIGNLTFDADATKTDNHVLTYDSSGDTIQLEAIPAQGTTLSTDTSPALGGTLTADGFNIEFDDSGAATDDRLRFGTGNDLEIYHDGTDSIIDNATSEGSIKLQDTSSTVVEIDADGVTVTGRALSSDGTNAITTDSPSSNVITFDLTDNTNFQATTTGDDELTFSNTVAGQSGNIFLTTGGGTISANAMVAINADALTALSTAGVYHLAYFVKAATGDNRILVSVSGALT